MRKKLTAFLLLLILFAMGLLSGCQVQETITLDPKNPVVITLWHYYNGAQKSAFDVLVEEFNSTVGLEQGIIVEAYNQGNVNTLIESVLDSANNKVGTDPIPNIFAGYADTAFQIDEMGLLADLTPYFTEEEIAGYRDSYINEGKLSGDTLKILPTAKSTEIFMLNKTDWDKFSEETGSVLEELATLEGLVQVAERYYEWTDAKTPDIPEDGKAFFGRDAFANYMIIGARQLGNEIFTVKDNQVTFQVEETVMRRLWDSYYVPFINGYYCTKGKFRTDDAKVGEILALVGSSTSATYFPTEVTVNDTNAYPIETLVMKAPQFEGGKDVAVQQGAGMAVTTSTVEKEYASTVFLKWFTDPEQNIEFSIISGYLPVKKEASTLESLDTALQNADETVFSDILKQTLKVSFETVETSELYTNKAFSNGNAARNILEHSLPDKATADRAEVEKLIAGGMTRQEAVEQFNTDENFTDWFNSLKESLENTQKGK